MSVTRATAQCRARRARSPGRSRRDHSERSRRDTASPAQEPTCARDRRLAVRTTEVRRSSESLAGCREFVDEQVRRGATVLTPPLVDCSELCIGFGCGADRQLHRRARNSSTISEAGRTFPSCADSHDCAKAACRARRSSSVRVSPSSSATRSTTVPSGSVVGSLRISRPFSTRARRGLM